LYFGQDKNFKKTQYLRSMTQHVLKIHPNDNVWVALRDLEAGQTVAQNGDAIKLLQAVPAKHKLASADLAAGDPVIMYGILVGITNTAIRTGELITTGNIHHATGEYRIGERKAAWQAPDVARWKDRTFMGYHRSNGQVGTGNYWVIVPLVFCENRNVELLKEVLTKGLGYRKRGPYEAMLDQLTAVYRDSGGSPEIRAFDLQAGSGAWEQQRLFQNIDGIKLLSHTLGCGGTRQDARALCGLLAGYITHPNVAGATVLSLGCQNAQMGMLKEEIEKRVPGFDRPMVYLEQQEIGSEKTLMARAIRETFAGLMEANKNERKPAPLDKLCLGMECGGSDGFSGISANPAVGKVADMLVGLGGAVILSEFPELCGVEQELSDRCVTQDQAGRFVQLMKDYQARAVAVGSGFDANPSPGNIRDGLVTDAIKSAGAAKKGGTSPVKAVLDYPEWVTQPGLNLLCTPGSDVESTTAEVGAGANIVLFTTGLGTPTGNPVTPVIKLATNTPLFEKMREIIDLDTGTIITGKESIEEVADRIMELVINVASGQELCKAQQLEQDDFIPWKRGVSL
jgi:altronate hydrolase